MDASIGSQNWRLQTFFSGKWHLGEEKGSNVTVE